MIDRAASSTPDLTTLYVDLDGTLIRSDLLYETYFRLLKNSPVRALVTLFTLLGGRARFKRAVARAIEFDPAALPYQEDFLRFLAAERNRGRRIVLATASDREAAIRVAGYLGIFEEVLASDGRRNLKGRAKLEVIEAHAGGKPFAYAGNSAPDQIVWERAAERIAVNTPASICKALRRDGQPITEFGSSSSLLRGLLRSIRPHQWVKNLLIFVPIIMAHRWAEPERLLMVGAGFIAFSLAASAVYLLNDLLDLEADRHHPRKRHRPLASGAIPIPAAVLLLPVLLVGAFGIGWNVTGSFVEVLALYFGLTVAYSMVLKQLVLVDILLLAGLYSIRVFAGGVAAGVPVSEWLLAFSMFFFLSLACVKRCTELVLLQRSNQERTRGRGYVAGDLDQIGRFGSASGYISVLVLALYVSSAAVRALYHRPELLWLVCPLLLYWISRVWLLGHRGELHDDPIVFALKDPVSYLVGGLCGAGIYLAI